MPSVKKLYLLKGTWDYRETSMYVLATDAGKAEDFANSKWESWDYNYVVSSIRLISSTEKYNKLDLPFFGDSTDGLDS